MFSYLVDSDKFDNKEEYYKYITKKISIIKYIYCDLYRFNQDDDYNYDYDIVFIRKFDMLIETLFSEEYFKYVFVENNTYKNKYYSKWFRLLLLTISNCSVDYTVEEYVLEYIKKNEQDNKYLKDILFKYSNDN